VRFPLALWFGLLAAGATGLGCQSSSRAPAPPRAPANNIPNPNRPFWDQPDNNNNRRAPTLNQPGADARGNGDGTRLTSGEQPDVNGVLAGVLVDSSGQRPSRAYIQVELAGSKDNRRPVDVAADENGYFMIPGLLAGRSYLLTARTQETGQLLVGRVQATVPNSRLYIRLREDLASGDVPPLPPSPGELLPANNRNNRGGNNPAPPPLTDPGPRFQHDGGWTPGGIGASNPQPLAPARENPNIPPPSSPVPNLENVAERERANPPAPPLINVPPSTPGTLPEPDPPPGGSGAPARSGSSVVPRSGALTPVCEISGQRVTRLVLTELDGMTWDLRNQHSELILVDFWGSWCQPCLRAIPHLVDLQRRYGPYGLEVVGIACEGEQGDQRDMTLRQVREKMNIIYPILLAEDRASCPVQRTFGIRSYPTLILLDKHGVILARADGANFTQIDAVIQQRLGRR
jgi:thiol-disulfide isomerase/thioredoxin